jgi:single-strand DNA-binding protein
MPNVNRVILAGHLCSDLEIRQAGGTSVATARLAIDDSYKSKSGDKVERTVFVDVNIWGRQAETTAQFCGKGSAVLIEGRLQMDEWDDKETGQKRSRLKVRAERVQFLGGKGKQDEPVPHAPAEPSAPSKSYDEIPF